MWWLHSRHIFIIVRRYVVDACQRRKSLWSHQVNVLLITYNILSCSSLLIFSWGRKVRKTHFLQLSTNPSFTYIQYHLSSYFLATKMKTYLFLFGGRQATNLHLAKLDSLHLRFPKIHGIWAHCLIYVTHTSDCSVGSCESERTSLLHCLTFDVVRLASVFPRTVHTFQICLLVGHA